MLIGLAKMDIEETLKYIKEFVPKINNWAVCDVFCAGLKTTKKYEEIMWNFILKYIKSKNEFEVRFSIVMMLDFFVKEEYIEKVLKELNEVNHSGYYVKMANAWAISICFIKFKDKTMEFLKNTKIDNFTYNKGIQKIIESYRVDDNTKQVLRKMKRV